MSGKGHGRKILGHDGAEAPGRQNTPLVVPVLDDGDKDDLLRGPSGVKAHTAPAPAAVYYLDMCPPVLDRKGFPMGAAFMRFWLSQPEFTKQDDVKNAHRVRVLDHDSLKKWKQTSKYPLDKLKLQRPWLGNRKDEVIKRVRDRFKSMKPGEVKTFPDDAIISKPPALTDTGPLGPFSVPPATEHTQWADEVDFWGLFNEDSNGDGAGPFEMATSSLDDYCFALGRYSWFFMPKGGVTRFPAVAGAPELMEVQISEVGIYAIDSYDFNGSQPLGIWDVDADDISLVSLKPWPFGPSRFPQDGLYKKKMGQVVVNNASFRRHREITKKGRDFIVYSEVKFFPVNGGSFRFEANTGKPV